MVWPSSCTAVSCCCGISMWLMLACASESTTSTRLLWKAESVSARARTSVDLPTPPLAFMTVMVLRIPQQTRYCVTNVGPFRADHTRRRRGPPDGNMRGATLGAGGRCGQRPRSGAAEDGLRFVLKARSRPAPRAWRADQVEEGRVEPVGGLVHDPVAGTLDQPYLQLGVMAAQDGEARLDRRPG